MSVSRIAFLPLLLVASLAGATTGSGAPTAAPTRIVDGWITALAMDGSQVAYATQAFAPTNCFKLSTWNVTTGAGALVSGPPAGNCASDEPYGKAVREVAVAGPHVAWIRNITGNTESDDYLYTASLPKPHEVELASATRTGDTGGLLRGNWIGGLVGSGTVLAADTWATDIRGNVTRAALNAIGALRITRVASGAGTLTAESADTGRIAVARADGSVAIYSAAGAHLRAIRPSSVKEIALRKDYLVVLTSGKTIEIYNSHTGAFIRRWAVPGGATNLDVNSDIAVFSVYRALYALQLTTGKQAVLATQRRAIVAARIEAPGVVYAYNTVAGAASVGHLVFLPLAGVKDALDR